MPYAIINTSKERKEMIKMRKTEFIAVTNDNNKFQTVVSKQLEECGACTNDYLKIARFSDKTILVSSVINKNFEKYLTKEDEKEETSLFIIKNDYENTTFILNLTPSQVRMFEWMQEKDMIDEWSIEPLNIKKIETI